MMRCIGAFFFGLASDRFGRKWTFIANLVLYALAGLVTGVCHTYAQFFATRVLYGNSAAIALEDAPIAAGGLVSGLLQEGFTAGIILASALSSLIADNQP